MNSLRKTLVLAVIAGLLVAGCAPKDTGNQDEQREIKQVVVQHIERDNVVENSVTVSATVVPRQYSVIRSLNQGTVEYLAPVGSEVVVGQSLFSIRNAQVEDSFFNAQRSLDQTKILGSQQVTQAELSLNSAEAQLNLAKSNLEIAERQTDQGTRSAYDGAVVTYNSGYNALSQSLQSLSQGSLTSISLKYRYTNLLTTNTEARNQAETEFSSAVGLFRALSPSATTGTVEVQLSEMQAALSQAKQALDLTAIALQSAVSGESQSETSLQSYRSLNATYQSQINQFSDGVIASINNVTNTGINNDLKLDQARNQLNVAQIQYDNAVVALENARRSAELQETSAQAQFDSASYNFGNLSLASPFSGTVLSHFAQVGDQVNPGEQVLELGAVEIVEMKIDLDVSLARGLSLGDEVLIEGGVTGFVSEIEPIGDLESGKVGVTIQANNENDELLAGDIVDVTVALEFSVDPSIVIPIKAATIEETGTTVFVIEDGVVAERTVTLGKVYGNKVTVEEGLTEGDELILPNGVFVSVGEMVESK